MTSRRNMVLVLAFGLLSILCILLLADIALPTPRETSLFALLIIQRPAPLWFVYILMLGASAGVLIAVFGSILGWFPQFNSNRLHFIDLVHELPHVVRPFFQDLSYSFFARPRVGFIGIIATIVGTLFIMLIWPEENTKAEKVGIGLGLAGLLFGVLGYNVAVRVDKGIRDSITDFRDFLKKVSEILEEEVLHESRSRIFGIRQEHASVSTQACEPGGIPDLILLLWFPYYGLTKDFNGVGQRISKQLLHVQENCFKTYLIAAKDPLALMTHFNKNYQTKDKRYCSETLTNLATKLQGKGFEDWDRIIRDVIFLGNGRVSDEVAEVEKCVKALKKLLAQDGSIPSWIALSEDNDKLMNGLVQLVWTPKKAAIVFMPPERVNVACADNSEELNNFEGGPNQHGGIDFLAGQNEPYKCSGFVTEDPFMNRMIRDLVRIRFGF